MSAVAKVVGALVVLLWTKVIKPEILLSKYREYQNIINNKSLEKKYDKMLFEKSKVSIYQVMKPIINK